MPILHLITHVEGDDCWPDLKADVLGNTGRVLHTNTAPIHVARLPGGMVGGKSSVSIRIDLADGRVVIAETSMALFLQAAQAFRIVEEREGSPP